jgi:hypothetical protein
LKFYHSNEWVFVEQFAYFGEFLLKIFHPNVPDAGVALAALLPLEFRLLVELCRLGLVLAATA